MIDPVTAVAMATGAFNAVSKLVAAGREVDDCFQQIGKWYSAVADFNEAKRQSENPPLLRKLVNKSSVEEEAMNIFIQQKKIAEQEKQLRELLLWSYGPQAYQELQQLRRNIRETRERTVYQQARKRKNLLWDIMGWSFVGLMSYALYEATVWVMSFNSTGV